MANTMLYAIIGLAIALFPVYKTFTTGDPLSHMYPNFLLFTPYREEAYDAWANIIKVDKGVKRHHTHIPEIDAKDYSFEALRQATDNWKHPAVVRGLFSDTTAVKKWGERGYLAERLQHKIPIVNNAKYGTLQNDRSVQNFGDAYNQILDDKESKLYIFFPVKSRFEFNGTDESTPHQILADDVNKLTQSDLDLKRIWNGFGTSKHATFFGSQLVMGRGSNTSDATTGTGWHCAAGNNYFIQVIGKKKWYFMDPEYSALMSPLRGGMVNMNTGNKYMSELHPHIPLRYVDLEAGDLLYNPDWEWHTIKNYEGLSVGCPIRELNISLSFRNNFQYTSIVAINKILEAVGAPSIGGYPNTKGLDVASKKE